MELSELFYNIGGTAFCSFLVYLIRYTYYLLGGE